MIAKQIKLYAKEDIMSAIKHIKSKYDLDLRVTNMQFKNSAKRRDDVIVSTTLVDTNNTPVTASWTYSVDRNGQVFAEDAAELGDALHSKYRKVCANTDTLRKKHRIVAADEDLDDSQFDRPDFMNSDPDDTISDSINDLADNVEDMQDQLDDADQDDPTIDIDNNISGHYIAECERCHGVFISAMIESDQDVEKISGKCPLCEHSTDQYLKWIIRSVEDSEDE